MPDETVQQPEETQQSKPVSLEVVKSNINLELSKNKYQEILQAAENINFTRDNITNVEPLKKLRGLLTIIDDVHKKGKEESLRVGRLWDTAKKELKSPIEAVLNRKTEQYTKIATEISQEKKKQDEEQKRVDGITSTIETVVLDFAKKISECKTPEELINVERLINFEKNGAQSKSKYQEFLPELIERLTALNEDVKKQKETVKSLVKLNQEIDAAGDSADVELLEKRDEIINTIDEAKITVQEKAITSSTRASMIPVAHTIHPDVKARRSTWKYEVKDINVTRKKMPAWTEILINETKVEEFLKGKKAEGIEEGVEEFEVAGIRFYLDKKY